MTALELYEDLPQISQDYIRKKNHTFSFSQFYPEIFQPSYNHLMKKKVLKLQESASHNAFMSTTPSLMEKFTKLFPEIVKIMSETIHNATNSVICVMNNRDVSMFKLEWVLNNLSDNAASELSSLIMNGTWSDVIAR